MKRYTEFKALVIKSTVLLIVLVLAGPSAGVLQCEIACAASRSATPVVPHCHDASGQGSYITAGGHSCDHDAGTFASTSSEAVQKSVVPVAATIASTVGTHSSLIVLEECGSFSPPGAVLIAPASRPLPLRI